MSQPAPRLEVPPEGAGTIGRNTRISIGNALMIVASIVGVGWALATRLTTVDNRLANLEASAAANAATVQAATTLVFRMEDLDRRITRIDEKGLAGLRDAMSNLEIKLKQIEVDLTARSADRFTGTDMDAWIERARLKGHDLPNRKPQ